MSKAERIELEFWRCSTLCRDNDLPDLANILSQLAEGMSPHPEAHAPILTALAQRIREICDE